jgi:hypothetical protein
MSMPEWLNWLSAICGNVGFVFGIWVYLRERRFRAALEAAQADLETTKKVIESTKQQLGQQLSHLEKMIAYANGSGAKVPLGLGE